MRALPYSIFFVCLILGSNLKAGVPPLLDYDPDQAVEFAPGAELTDPRAGVQCLNGLNLFPTPQGFSLVEKTRGRDQVLYTALACSPIRTSNPRELFIRCRDAQGTQVFQGVPKDRMKPGEIDPYPVPGTWLSLVRSGKLEEIHTYCTAELYLPDGSPERVRNRIGITCESESLSDLCQAKASLEMETLTTPIFSDRTWDEKYFYAIKGKGTVSLIRKSTGKTVMSENFDVMPAYSSKLGRSESRAEIFYSAAKQSFEVRKGTYRVRDNTDLTSPQGGQYSSFMLTIFGNSGETSLYSYFKSYPQSECGAKIPHFQPRCQVTLK